MIGRGLTPRQHKILEFIVEFTVQRGYPPTLREIGERFGIRSTKGVQDHIDALQRKGYLRRRPSISRGIEVKTPDKETIPSPSQVLRIPVLGRISAGKPILAEENVEGFLQVDAHLIRQRGDFALRVKGDSMVDAGIHDGDWVIVRQQPVAEKGEIVVALIGDEATVKRYYPQKDCIRLEPANKRYTPVILKEGAKILGKVVGLIRRYK
jgi:repressor LexA